MSIMCSLAVCKAQQGMCGHEKVMLGVAVLSVIGIGAYFLIGCVRLSNRMLLDPAGADGFDPRTPEGPLISRALLD